LSKRSEEARQQGYKVIRAGPVHYWIRNYSLDPEGDEKE
jgi:hypothetical protein